MIKQNQIKSKAFIVFSKEYFWNITIRIKRGNLLKGYKKKKHNNWYMYKQFIRLQMMSGLHTKDKTKWVKLDEWVNRAVH